MAGTAATCEFGTVADLLERLEDVPTDRIRLRPSPGAATEEDVIRIFEQAAEEGP